MNSLLDTSPRRKSRYHTIIFDTRTIEFLDEKKQKVTKTLTVYQMLLEAARARMSPTSAAHFAGVGVKFVVEWLHRGEADLVDFYEECIDVMTLEAQFYLDWWAADGRTEFQINKAILKCALEGNWMAGMTMNERRNPRDYGRKSTVALEGETTTRILIEEVTGADWQTGGRAIREDVVDSHLLPAGEEK